MVEVVEIVVVVAWFVSLFVAILIVPRLAGKKSEDRLVAFLTSERSEPLWDKAAERVMVKLEPRITGLEDRINEPVQIDLAPIVSMVTESVVPRVRDEVEKVRAVIDGKIGWVKKVAKGTGEAVAEAIGEEAALEAAGGDPLLAEGAAQIEAMLTDVDWVKAHPAAAFGLRLFKRSQGSGSNVGSGYRFRRRRNR